MGDDRCSCCDSTDDPSPSTTAPRGGWLGQEDVLRAELPDRLQRALGRFLGADSVPTLGDWAASVRGGLSGDSVAVEHLCVTDEATEHWGEVGGERYQFVCFFDAIVLSSIVDEPVDIRTISPHGTTITARASGSSLVAATPETAVTSFGIDPRLATAKGSPTLEEGYAAICPYVNAFEDRAAYDRWAATIDAPAVGMPLSASTALAHALVS